MNLYMIDNTTPNLDIGLALTYGGIVQVLAGMWYVDHAGLVLDRAEYMIGKWHLGTHSARRRLLHTVLIGSPLPFSRTLIEQRLSLMQGTVYARKRP